MGLPDQSFNSQSWRQRRGSRFPLTVAQSRGWCATDGFGLGDALAPKGSESRYLVCYGWWLGWVFIVSVRRNRNRNRNRNRQRVGAQRTVFGLGMRSRRKE